MSVSVDGCAGAPKQAQPTSHPSMDDFFSELEANAELIREATTFRTIGRGRVMFKEEKEPPWKDLGDAPEFTMAHIFDNEVEALEHVSNRLKPHLKDLYPLRKPKWQQVLDDIQGEKK